MISRRRLLLAALAPHAGRILFKARGSGGLRDAGERLARIEPDGTGFEVLDFHRPNEVGWGAYAFFGDGRRAVLLSIEPKSGSCRRHWSWQVTDNAWDERIARTRSASPCG
jgi:hypothetical protein